MLHRTVTDKVIVEKKENLSSTFVETKDHWYLGGVCGKLIHIECG
jgi:hypothetical protein